MSPAVPHDPSMSARRRKRRRLRNRRRPNLPTRWLAVLSALLVIECGAALRFSPRFEATAATVRVTGLSEIPEDAVLARVGGRAHGNLLALPVDKIAECVRQLPQVEAVDIRRRLPNRVELAVTERTPYANLADDQGRWFLCDRKFVPYRRLEKPVAELPTVEYRRIPGWAILPGCAVGDEAEVAPIRTCLAWAQAHPAFPVTRVTMDGEGKLCLNRRGDVPVRLGSERRLEAKLDALNRLLEARPQLASATDIDYINLYAENSPALRLKSSQSSLP